MTILNTNIKSWFSLHRLFDFRPMPINLDWAKLLLSVGLALIVAAIIIKIIIWKKNASLPSRARKKFYVRISDGALYFGLSLLAFVGCSLERIYFFSARLWMVIWGVSLLIWLIALIRYRLKVVPQIEARITERQLFSKYLIPKRRQT